MSAVGGTPERFASLQGDRLERAWRADLPGSVVPHVVVALPSYSLDRSVLEHYGDRVAPLENRFLYVLLRAADPFTRVVYLSSRLADPQIVDGYLSLAAPSQRRQILDRVLLVSPNDVAPGALAEKALAQPMLLDEVRRFIGADVGLIEPWNVTEAERDFAVALDLPMYGTDPSLWRLATKSGGRRLFRELGVPHPAGSEGVTSPDDVTAAIRRLRRADPALAGVVVKLDDSVAGDGNVVLRRQVLDEGSSLHELVRRALPPWYVDVLRHGGVVEELVAGDEFCSPSGQAEVRPDGTVAVLATHDQRLGGANGQVFEGCTFPARDEYATVIAEHVATIGQALVDRGVVGRFAVDFAAVRRRGAWDVRALEINLRKGGTTHPYGLTRLITGGRYDPDTSSLRLADGTSRCYGATDNLVDDAWCGRSPGEVRRRIADAGLSYDHDTRCGVVPHLLDCLAVDGRMGYTAIGEDHVRVRDLEARLRVGLA